MRIRGVYKAISQLKFALFPLIAIFVVLVNMVLFHSLWIGMVGMVLYFLLMGLCLGKTFLSEEHGAFTRFMFGVFLSISFFVFTGLAVTMIYQLNFLSLTGILVAPLLLVILLVILGGKMRRSVRPVIRSESVESAPVFSPLFVVPLALIAYAFYLLVQARSGWVEGNVWAVVSPSFFYVYFAIALSLLLVIFLCRTRSVSKLFLILLYSVLSTLVWAVVLYPGNLGDPLGHMGFANMIYSYGNWRPGFHPVFLLYWLLKGKALAVFTASLAKLSLVDVYWVHTFGAPILWGVFVPLSAYGISNAISGKERIGILAALISSFYGFISWGARPSANALGFVFYFGSLYFTLRHLKSGKERTYLLLALFTAIVSGVSHPLTGTMSFISIFLAVTFKRCELMKLEKPREARFLLVISLLVSVLLLPFILFVNGFLYIHFSPSALRSAYIETATAFSVQKLLETDLWNWIFGAYIDLDFKGMLHSVVVPFLGLVGMAYILKRGNKTSRVPTLVVSAAFLIYIVDNRILKYAMVNTPFGADRILVFLGFVTIPFAALTICLCTNALGGSIVRNPDRVISFFGGVWTKFSVKQIFALFLMGISLSSFAASSIERSYGWLGGLQPTELEVETVKYIDEHTSERYVVVTMSRIAAIGWGFVGTWNPNKWYVYEKGNSALGRNPSVSTMYDQMRMRGADVGYFVASSFRTPNYNQVIEEASRIFRLFEVLSNEHGEIRIFEYRVAPLPTSPEVMAYWWTSPPAYFIQNDKMRIILNPTTKTLEVLGFWGDRYESLDLNATLLGGEGLGNLLSVEYYDPTGDSWTIWEAGQDVPQSSALAAQFKFRINFLRGSLVGVVEQGSPFVQLWWENAVTSTLNFQLGDFHRLYIPGLVEGVESYNVSARDFGLFYTVSRTDNVTLHPAYNYEIEASSLSFKQITSFCNLTIHKRYVTYDYFKYDIYIDNNAELDEWAFVEAWLPDEVHMKTFPPLAYSVDGGKTWVRGLPYSRDPMETVGGAEVNWVLSNAGWANKTPGRYVYSTDGIGGSPWVLDNFTSSGGGQNRIIFGVYLPPEDEILVRIGTSLYYKEPRRITYWFTDSFDESYGLRNLQKGLVALYNVGSSEYVGGLSFSQNPSWLAVTENAGVMEEISVTISGDTVISLLSGKDVNTAIDVDGDGVPDYVEGVS